AHQLTWMCGTQISRPNAMAVPSIAAKTASTNTARPTCFVAATAMRAARRMAVATPPGWGDLVECTGNAGQRIVSDMFDPRVFTGPESADCRIYFREGTGRAEKREEKEGARDSPA